MTKKNKKLNISINDEVVEAAAKELCKRIDFSVMAGLLQESGWVHVKVDDADITEVDDWVKQNVKDTFNHYENEWVFKSQQDANWFKLRWDAQPGDCLFGHRIRST